MNYKKLYDEVGSRIGWNFDGLKVKVFGKKWNFLDVVKRYALNDHLLLDIGTGSGEKLLKISEFVKNSCGVDNSKNMIIRAKENLEKSGISNTFFFLADAAKLPFKKEVFDIVICRHSPFFVEEVCRVLKTHGVFITQQVMEDDKENIKNVFGRGQSFGIKSGASMGKYIKELKKGFDILRSDTYNADEYYTEDELIFLLNNTPIIPDFDVEKDQKFLEEIKRIYKTKDGIKTNSSRFLIIARKS